jgi:hypothetical protein
MSLARVCAAIAAVVTLAACNAAQPSSNPAVQEARAVVEAIYAPYLNRDMGVAESLLGSAPWTNDLRSRIEELEALQLRIQDEVIVWGELTFDPIIQSQENYLYDARANLRVGVPTINDAGVAIVEVRFGDVVMQYELVREDSAWRVRNIVMDDWNLAAAVQHDLDEGHAYEECRRAQPASQCALE